MANPPGKLSPPRRPNLSAGAPGWACGFSYSIPFSYQDGRCHTLSLTLADGTAIEFPTRGGVTRSNMRFRFHEHPSSLRDGSDETQAAVPTPNALDYSMQGWRTRPTTARSPDGRFAAAFRTSASRCGSLLMAAPRGRLFAISRTTPCAPLDCPPAVGNSVSSSRIGFLMDLRICSRHCLMTAARLPSSPRTAAPRTRLSSPPPGPPSPRGSSTGSTARVSGDGLSASIPKPARPKAAYACRSSATALPSVKLSPTDRAWTSRGNTGAILAWALSSGCQECCSGAGAFEFVFKALPEGDELAGSPLPVRQCSMESACELLTLSEAVDELCAKAFKLQRHVRDMLPSAEATVLCYDGWARRYQTRLLARMAAPEPMAGEPPLISVVMHLQTNLAHLTGPLSCARADLSGMGTHHRR